MKAWNYNLRHIRIFVKTMQLGTLTKVSKIIHLSQPALSQAITKLENKLGVGLFNRESDGMKPTEAAHIIYPRFVTALNYIKSNNVTNAQARAFVALARGGNYAEASALTGLAPASLHRAISDLEICLQKKLVERRGRGLNLTKQGRNISRRYRLAQTEIIAGLQEIADLNGERSGRIAIGAMPLCRARILPASIVKYQEINPKTGLIVAEGSYGELIEPLRDGELDFLIGAMRDPLPGADLVQEPLFTDLPIILSRALHPLAKENVTLDTLAQYDWCVPSRGTPLRESWQSMFTERGIKVPFVRVECGSVITIRQILMETDCLTILSPEQVAVELEAGWLTKIYETPPNLKRTIGIIYRLDWRATDSQKSFLNILRNNIT